MPEFGSDRMWGLEELPLPEAVPWLPLTAGWLVVALALIGIATLLADRHWRAWQKQAYRRDALARIDRIRDRAERLEELPAVLRATALRAFPREEVAGLRGSHWILWLNQNGGRFDPTDAEALADLPYDPDRVLALSEADRIRLLAASRAWIEGHHARL